MEPSLSDSSDTENSHLDLEKKLGFVRLPNPANEQHQPMALSGKFDVITFSSGISLSLEALTANRNSVTSGIMDRSLHIRLALDRHKPKLTTNLKLFQAPKLDHFAAYSISEPVTMNVVIQKNQRFRTLGIHASPENLKDDNLADLLDKTCNKMAILPIERDPRLVARAEEFFTPGFTGTVGNLLAESFVLEILARTLDALTPSRNNSVISPRDHKRLVYVRDKLISEPGDNHRLIDLARESGMGVTQLRTKFARAFGQPIGAFLREVRMMRAYEGLKREGWTASQAAYFVGYRHPSSFSYAFRRRFGISPSDIQNH